ncbi:MAG: DUF1273 family protein [Selenomonadaceae bacterium]|nr:DUF1273 family protein [Selenomonadaceae bacterium]
MTDDTCGIEGKSCCFIGHREMEITDELTSRLTREIEKLINGGVCRFIFGSRSSFDFLCHSVVSELKKRYPKIVRIAYTTFHECVVLEKDLERHNEVMSFFLKKEVHDNGYEEEITPEKLRKSGRAAYVERNRMMIDDSDYCVFYYDETYRPKRKKLSRKYVCNILSSARSGTALAYSYALRKKKTIINVYRKESIESEGEENG